TSPPGSAPTAWRSCSPPVARRGRGGGHRTAPSVRGLVETTVRRGPDATFRFLVNRTDRPVTVPRSSGRGPAGRQRCRGALTLKPRGGVAVMRRTGD
ncbi:hypothetical protein GTV15_04425, partial [Streptomyces sp. SID7803]|nr:hypothetical protein [Streptomyces sp. SID7803]